MVPNKSLFSIEIKKGKYMNSPKLKRLEWKLSSLVGQPVGLEMFVGKKLSTYELNTFIIDVRLHVKSVLAIVKKMSKFKILYANSISNDNALKKKLKHLFTWECEFKLIYKLKYSFNDNENKFYKNLLKRKENNFTVK